MTIPKWRPFTWVILAINLLFVWWVIAGIASASHAADCGTLSQSTCDGAAAVGTAIGIGIIIFLWAAIDVILGVSWAVTRPKRRMCPACGTDVKTGLTACGSCGYDFVSATRVAPLPARPDV